MGTSEHEFDLTEAVSKMLPGDVKRFLESPHVQADWSRSNSEIHVERIDERWDDVPECTCLSVKDGQDRGPCEIHGNRP